MALIFRVIILALLVLKGGDSRHHRRHATPPEEKNSTIVKEHEWRTEVFGGIYAEAAAEFTVSLQFKMNNEHFCGGTVVDPHHVVTAAHCVKTRKKLLAPADIYVLAWAGHIQGKGHRHAGVVHEIKNIYVHPGYRTDRPTSNDIAILKVAHEFDRHIKPLKLQENNIVDGTLCHISGWGFKSNDDSRYPEVIRMAKLPILNHGLCKEMYSSRSRQLIEDNMICAGGVSKDACKGDSGGPLICGKQLTGVISFGPSDCNPIPTAANYIPGVYTNILHHSEWISDVINEVEAHAYNKGSAMSPLLITIAFQVFIVYFAHL